ncbi:MAG TPA: hypothetical protein VN524_06340 [Hyphomicrobiaceae bacterium]|jgi:hypothetical protein|nr:hypothetical protein [Hyphomicrobiaceae bacterium]
MSLIRLAFWLGLLVLLLPTDAQQQARFSTFAGNAVERVGSFCDRNGRTCAAGSEVWATFLRKAEFGMRLVGDLLGAGGRRPVEPGPQGAPPAATSGVPPAAPYDRRPGNRQGTVRPSDGYQPPWRAPGRPGGG